MKKITISLTRVEACHLLQLLINDAEDGSYYGRKDHWYNRTAKLKWLLFSNIYPEMKKEDWKE